MEDKPLYDWPGARTRTEKQNAALARLDQHKKMRTQMTHNLILGAIILALSFLCPSAILRIVLILIALGNWAVGLLLYHFQLMTFDEGQFLRVYPDRLEHCQSLGLTGKHLTSVIYFDEIASTAQDKRGRLAITLSPKDAPRSTFTVTDKQGNEAPYPLKDSTALLRFPEAAPKLHLIDAYPGQLKYPKKQYKKLDDDDDYYSKEDLEWDPLHKHGL